MSVKCILTNQLSQGELDGYASIENLNLHIADKNNPHKMTALQTGAIAKKTTYYSTSMGTDLADTITDSPFLIGISSTNNAGLHAVLIDTFAYVIQIFYNDTNRMQLAVGYTNGKIASRTNKNGTWSDWVATVNTSQPMTFSVNESGGLTVTY